MEYVPPPFTLTPGIITTALLADGAVTNAKVNAGAAIARSKLNFGAGLVDADIAAAAAIAYAKLNLTGSIVNADVSATAAIAYAKLNLTASIVDGDIVSVTTAKITDFVAAVQAQLNNLDAKQEVNLATTVALPTNTYNNGNGTLTGTANGALTVDSVVVLAGWSILVKNEAAQERNGIYTVTQVGVPAVSPYILTRRSDMNTAPEFVSGLIVPVKGVLGSLGAVNDGTIWISVAASPFTIGTTAINFGLVGSAYVAGSGLTLTGNSFSIGTGQVTSGMLLNGTIVAADVNAAAAIDYTQLANVSHAPDVQIFKTAGSFTWTKPTWATWVRIFCIGAGGGGGSGRKGPNGAIRNGGGSAGGGGLSPIEIAASDLGPTVNVTVGAGGPGGAAQTTNSTDGIAGTAGGSSFFGPDTATGFCMGSGGTAGGGGTAASGGGAGSNGGGLFSGGNGVTASSTGLVGPNAGTGAQGAGGAGAGAGITAANATSAGGNGSRNNARLLNTLPQGGTAGGGNGDNGNNGALPNSPTPGGGGAGGGSSTAGNSGAGGNGSVGGGGGGGAAGTDGVGNSGKGGDGADGMVVIISIG